MSTGFARVTLGAAAEVSPFAASSPAAPVEVINFRRSMSFPQPNDPRIHGRRLSLILSAANVGSVWLQRWDPYYYLVVLRWRAFGILMSLYDFSTRVDAGGVQRL